VGRLVGGFAQWHNVGVGQRNSQVEQQDEEEREVGDVRWET
jgi:hypothetical protein